MKSSRIRRTSGRRAAEALLGLAILAATACNYGFEGGGFPSHIRTIYIETFENETAQFDLNQRLYLELQDELPGQLGVRPAGRENADAILSGRILRYDDVAMNYRPGSAGGQATDILSHEVQIGISVRLVDVRENVIRWESSALTGRGTYRPDTQSDADGQVLAIENIVEQIIDGAQSQW